MRPNHAILCYPPPPPSATPTDTSATRRENNNNFGLLVVVEEVITSIARVVLRRNDVSPQLMIAGKAGIACHICIIMR